MGLQKTSNIFHWLDYIILALSLVVSCSVGIYFALSGGRQRTTAEFLMGDRSMKVVPVAMSLVASFLSAILILGHPAEIYLNGIGYHFWLIGTCLAYIMAATLFVSLLYPLRLTSVFEYLEWRFKSRLVRCVGTLLNLLSIVLYIGMATFAPCTATERVTAKAVRREYLIAVCGIIGIFYTMIGGMKAVVWVDAIQACIMMAGTLAIAVRATIDSGGWQAMWEMNMAYGRLQVPSVTVDPRERHSMWGVTIGSAMFWLCACGVSQTSVQRFSSLPSIGAARRSLLLGMPGHLLLSSLCTLVGMAIFGRYASAACDIVQAGWVDRNQIVTYYVMDRIHVPGFPGLFTSALLAAALSSVSSALTSASTITWTDLMQPYICRQVSETRATFIAKALVVAYGIAGTLIAFLVANLGGTVIQAASTFMGAVAGPAMGLFLLGSLFPAANWFGATVGSLAGLACGIWVGAGSYSIKLQLVRLPSNVTGCDALGAAVATNGSTAFTAAANVTSVAAAGAASAPGFLAEYIYSISYMWITTIGLLLTLLIGLPCSWISERGRYIGFVDPITVPERYLMPGARQLWKACEWGRVRIDVEEAAVTDPCEMQSEHIQQGARTEADSKASGAESSAAVENGIQLQPSK